MFESVRKLRKVTRELLKLPNQLSELKDLVLYQHTKSLQFRHPNPLNRYGRKCFSQADEDGITLEILRRINKTADGVYAEFGVGDGTENNTLILAALGWKGFWVGNETLKFDVDEQATRNFRYVKDWVTLENIVALTEHGMAEIGATALDVVSLDLDGNDIYLVERLLAGGIKPKLFIVEYNAKFPPPVKFAIAYDPAHAWQGNDYFGASLASFAELFDEFGYRLICCNSQTGCNAFFVESAYSEYFSDVPADINDIYVEPRYWVYNKYGHAGSLKTIKHLFRSR